MREGSGETTVAVAPGTAFAYLADPRHAPEWFAGVELQGALEGLPRAGMTWSFVQTQRGGRIVPARMAVYAPPERFVWRTTQRWPRTNLAWELRCAPVEDPDTAGGAPATWVHLTIHIEPGPLGWLSLLAALPFQRGEIAERAQRAVDRAREALLARAQRAHGRHERPRQGQAKDARGPRGQNWRRSRGQKRRR
jgi:uncharacterized protein YndB with AHSA1/START domain